MDNKKSSGRDKLLICLGVLIILVFALYMTLYFYKIYRDKNPKTETNKSSEINNNKKSADKKEKEDVIVKNNDIIDYDVLNEKIAADSKMNIIEKCNCPENADETNQGECTKYVIDNEKATNIVNKLMESKEAQKLSTSSFCSAYSFSIKDQNENTIINGFVGDNKKSILVGYDSEGYAFDYESEVLDLFDGLLEDSVEYTENN